MIEELTQENFDTKVLDSDTACVIDFYASWCAPCKLVSNMLAKLAGEYDGKVRFYRLDTDKNTELSQKLKVSDLPTVLFLKGSKMDIQRGTTTEDKMRAKIEALSDGDNK
ncbi:Thioredoxin [subsurface metagenome]